MDTTPIQAYQCGHCGKAYLHQQQADDCCVNPGCALPDCDKPKDGRNNSSYCSIDHQREHWDLIEQQRIMRGEPIEWDGVQPLFVDEEAYTDLDDYWEELESRDVEQLKPDMIPDWVPAARRYQLSVDLVGMVLDRAGDWEGEVEDYDAPDLGDTIKRDLAQLSERINTAWQGAAYYVPDYRYRIPLRQIMLPYFDKQDEEG